MRTKRFWVSLAERAVKTFFQTLIAVWPIGDATLGLYDVDWKKSASVAAMAAIVSAVMSMASAPIGPDGSPSLVGEPPKQPAAALEPDPEDETPSGRHVLDDDPDDIPISEFTNPAATRYDRKEPRA